MKSNAPYHNLIEREIQVRKFESKGLRMLHDNFGKSWQPGDEPHGVMVFTDEPGIEAPETQARDLEAEIDELRAEIGELRNPNR